MARKSAPPPDERLASIPAFLWQPIETYKPAYGRQLFYYPPKTTGHHQQVTLLAMYDVGYPGAYRQPTHWARVAPPEGQDG